MKHITAAVWRGRPRLASILRLVPLSGLVLTASAAAPAHAYSFMQNGVLMGTVCRNGSQFSVYAVSAAQPVGQSCQITDSTGKLVAWGVITGE
jgi:hypothetical protein